MIRIALVDDHELVRHGIRALLELDPAFAVVAEAADGEQALRCVRTDAIDVMLLDLRMPRLGGLDVLRALRDAGSPIATIVLTTFHADADLIAALKLGARGYLLKDVSFAELVATIHAVRAGQRVFSTVPSRVPEELGPPSPLDPAPEALTPREAEVVRLMAAGYSNREISDALALAEGTVKNHVSMILAKLGARDRVRAVLTAMEHGLV
jgi:DNA-binding NarL/FixJ family response regulator